MCLNPRDGKLRKSLQILMQFETERMAGILLQQIQSSSYRNIKLRFSLLIYIKDVTGLLKSLGGFPGPDFYVLATCPLPGDMFIHISPCCKREDLFGTEINMMLGAAGC